MKLLVLTLYLLFAQITSVYAEIPAKPQYTAEAVLLMCADTGLVLYENEGMTQMYPASITKIMTALVVLELENDLSTRIEFCDDAIWGIPRTSSHISMDVGETLTVEEALYALMLRSANDVSIALALHTAGSVEAFTDLMNRRAASIGAENTHFTNPHGLHGRNHVTTAYDMALIMREAVKNPIFTEIISTLLFNIPPTERQPETRHLLNTHRQIHPGPIFDDRIIGGKTGWTTPAGNTLVTYANYNNRRLIAVVLQGNGAYTYDDTAALFDFGFALPMETVTVLNAETYNISVPVYQLINENQTEIGRAILAPEQSITFDLPQNWNHSWLRVELSAPETLEPPVLPNEPLGRVTIYVQNVKAGEAYLTAREPVYEYAPVVIGYDSTDYAQIPYESAYPYEEYYNYPPPTLLSEFLSLFDTEYVLLFAIPLAFSAITLIIAFIALITRRYRRRRNIVSKYKTRFERYPHYRYKGE